MVILYREETQLVCKFSFKVTKLDSIYSLSLHMSALDGPIIDWQYKHLLYFNDNTKRLIKLYVYKYVHM